MRCLGEGGFATVWAVAPSSRPPYALKLAKAATELSTRRMRRESAALALVGAPWVPGLIDQGLTPEGHAWLSMELIAGDNLGDLIASGLSPARCRDILRGLLTAVVQLHAAGLIHRDLKPDNIIVGPDGRVTLLDLGMARGIGDAADPFAGTIAGSAEYMAPEQLDSAAVTDRADVYSMGVIVFEMCALRPPFTGGQVEVERGHRALRPPPLLEASPELEAFCNEALRKDPATRPSSAELLKRIEAGSLVLEATVSRRRTAAGLTVVRERPEPVVLMWAELARLDRTMLAIFGAHKFRVVSQRGRRVLAAILVGDHPNPAGEALAVAEELVSAGSRVVVHLADCVVAGERISGAAISDPETWTPAVGWSGLRLTGTFAATINRSVAPARDVTSFFALVEETGAMVLGRDAIVEKMCGWIDGPLVGPGFVLVTGAVGVGKTTVADELSRRLTARGVRVWQATVTPPGRDRGGGAGTALFSTLVPGLSDRPVVPDQADAIRAMARESPLAVVLDDVDHAEHELLSALEYMTLGGGDRSALWVVGFATPQVLARRPDLGRGAERSHRIELEGLDDDASVALAAQWLTPVDYLPVASLRTLLAVARGNPLHIVSLCRELRERGAIREGDGGYYLDTAMLEQLPALALAPWLATRQLAGLPEETMALARVCSVLGESFGRAEVTAIVELLDGSAAGRISIDVNVGLAELCAAGVLEEDDWRLRFVNGLVCEGIYAKLAGEERAAVHHLARTYWIDYWIMHTEETVDQVAVPRIARHARAIGDRRWAARTCAELARAADVAHRFVEAEQQWSAALQFVDDPSDRAEVLVGRARARYRQQRISDAIADAHGAVEIFREQYDRDRLVDALLEAATALDWDEDFAASAERAAEASACGSQDPRRSVRIAHAERRAEFRKRPVDAGPALRDVAVRAAELADEETAVIAAMQAGFAFILAGRFDEAEEVFSLGEQACKRSGDQFHFAALLINRITLRFARGEIDRSIAEMREAIRLAREHGQAAMERAASYNLAEELLWRGQLEEASELAQRSMNLQMRHARHAITDHLLVLRISAVRGERDQVKDGLRFIADQGWTATNEADRCFLDILANWLTPVSAETARLMREAETALDAQQAIEAGWLMVSTATLDEATTQAFAERASASRVHFRR